MVLQIFDENNANFNQKSYEHIFLDTIIGCFWTKLYIL
jgi:hypothetical protein